MSKVQTRRSISVSIGVWTELTAAAARHGLSASSIAECGVRCVLDRLKTDTRGAVVAECRPNPRRLGPVPAITAPPQSGQSPDPPTASPCKPRGGNLQRHPRYNGESATRAAARLVLETGCTRKEAAAAMGVTEGALGSAILSLRVALAKSESDREEVATP